MILMPISIGLFSGDQMNSDVNNKILKEKNVPAICQNSIKTNKKLGGAVFVVCLFGAKDIYYYVSI